jgi:hypothetical protein
LSSACRGSGRSIGHGHRSARGERGGFLGPCLTILLSLLGCASCVYSSRSRGVVRGSSYSKVFCLEDEVKPDANLDFARNSQDKRGGCATRSMGCKCGGGYLCTRQD